MTREEIKNTPELVDFMLDKCVLADSRTKVYKRLEEVCNLAIKALEQEPKTGHWISVSERLPEDKLSVLVWCPQYKNIYCAYLEKEQWWIFGAFVQIVPNEVVAWMPLPPCYEPQERSDKE